MFKAFEKLLPFHDVRFGIGGYFQLLGPLITLCLVQPIGLFAQNQTIRAEASFSPATVSIGKNSIYKVVIFGTQALPKGKMPSVPGLTISNSPQMFRSASLINGTPSVTMELSFQARPTKQGLFTFPSWVINVGGNSTRIPTATLRVLSPNQQDALLKEKEKQQQKDIRQAAFVEFDTPRDFLFEGETVPATISLFLMNGLPVTRLPPPPNKIGDSFSMTEIRQRDIKRNFLRNGKSYTVFSWPVGLTAAMAGNHKLGFEVAIQVRVKTNNRNSPFNSPFFNDPFIGFGREQSLVATSDEQTIEVRSLPMKGRPQGFQGAIGSFTSISRLDMDRVSLGDPVKLTFEISGSGNFAAIPAPEIKSSEKLRVGSPKFSFEGNEITKHEGMQSFEYILTPLTPGLIEVPPVEFSFFDPIQETFFPSGTPAHPLRVDPGEKWSSGNPDNISSPGEDEETKTSTADLFQTESEPGEWVNALEQSLLFENPAFWYFQSIPLLSFCALTFWGLTRRSGEKEKLRQREIVLSRQMKDSVGFNDASSFLRAFRDLVRIRLASLRNHPNPSSLSSDELVALLQSGDNTEELITDVKELLMSCDDQEFAGNELARHPLDTLYQKGAKLIQKLK
jgi:hypothetical protein